MYITNTRTKTGKNIHFVLIYKWSVFYFTNIFHNGTQKTKISPWLMSQLSSETKRHIQNQPITKFPIKVGNSNRPITKHRDQNQIQNQPITKHLGQNRHSSPPITKHLDQKHGIQLNQSPLAKSDSFHHGNLWTTNDWPITSRFQVLASC